eukprot:CAMPEP_0197643200 /NCGR_PEP_ID=MMETSP1338-20131121/16611_1 /TAXON_ID=43686 ORGANISM="Pelagodinium beii, Strain RCC1491" /NCGR_SAMPLE_ID=MMETSP1338 /ASSEMBLY_ACC=CAM_ASM_000754 /LENGTH=429 /DNA_ID=CAMNT_0043216429 /DNA_START=65 /DNA_END=1352 /DNA_ORIENTATION=+
MAYDEAKSDAIARPSSRPAHASDNAVVPVHLRNTEDDLYDPTKDSRVDYEDPPPLPPGHVNGVLSYEATSNQPLRGVPIREDSIYLLSADEEVVEVTLSLHVNGFVFQHDGQEYSFAFSPFGLVRNCKFQAITSQGIDLSEFRCFKVSMFTKGACFYFGVREHESDASQAEEVRSRWVTDIAKAMRLVTASIFPAFRIACDPLLDVPLTRGRIMAGYLAHHDDASIFSVLYCELHPQSEDQARMVIYENESCKDPLRAIYITERSSCCEKVGISCSCFTLEEHLFSARSIAERRLWLRAISNIKVKVQNKAPRPAEEELKQYRAAIRDHVREIGADDPQAATDALLRRYFQSSDFPAPPEGYSQDGHFYAPQLQLPSHASANSLESSQLASEKEKSPEEALVDTERTADTDLPRSLQESTEPQEESSTE